MKLCTLRLEQFRNYTTAFLHWHPNLNLIYGQNAQGKTNLLEAIAYLSLGSSFREQKEEHLLQWQQDYFYLAATLEKNQQEHSISAGYQKKRRLWKKDGVVCKKTSEIAGFLHTVVFTPEDLELVKKGPEQRRRFLDREMVQLFAGYHLFLNQYQKALQQRNALLRQLSGQHLDQTEQDALLLPWEESLAKAGAVIVQKRFAMVQQLETIAREIHRHLSNGKETLALSYQTRLKLEQPLADLLAAGQLSEIFLQHYSAQREIDLKQCYTHTGPHRDDIKITVNGVDLRHFGSQGQQRTAALAMKLSEVELVRQIKGEYPILLLDDVLSELDAGRRQALLAMMWQKAQIFITATEKETELLWQDAGEYATYQVKQGVVQQDGETKKTKDDGSQPPHCRV